MAFFGKKMLKKSAGLEIDDAVLTLSKPETARIEWTLALVALNRTERAIARAAYLDEFGVRPKVALVTRKRGAK